MLHTDPNFEDPERVRAACRTGVWTGPTSGAAPGRMQVNLVVLPEADARDFFDFCRENPRPCPVLAMSEPGRPHVPALGKTIDLRTDLPGFILWRVGAAVAEPADITPYWRDDLVGFALGCSFGFEAALLAAGFDLPHVTNNTNVAMYDTSIPLTSAGPFSGNMVVSMRFVPESRLDEAAEISGRFPQCHGGPVHIGDPNRIGIRSLERPDYGDPPEGNGVPVFWACGVTPQAALRQACLPFAITHSPGRMLVCDVPATWDHLLTPVP